MRRMATKSASPQTTTSESPHASLRPMRPGHLWLIGALIGTVVLLGIVGADIRPLLRYERSEVLQGEWWRLLTGHLVHGNSQHLALNVAGTGLVALLFGRDYSAAQWLFILLAGAACIDAGFVFCEPQLVWYVGFSGVLHSAVAAGIVAWWRYENRYLTLAIALLMAFKLGWEQWHGALPLSGDMPVIVDAHLYGSIGGVLAAALLAIKRRRWPLDATSL